MSTRHQCNNQPIWSNSVKRKLSLSKIVEDDSRKRTRSDVVKCENIIGQLGKLSLNDKWTIYGGGTKKTTCQESNLGQEEIFNAERNLNGAWKCSKIYLLNQASKW